MLSLSENFHGNLNHATFKEVAEMKPLKMLFIVALVSAVSLMPIMTSIALGQEGGQKSYFFVYNAIGGDINPFWATIRKGFEDACKQLGAKGLYLNPTTDCDEEQVMFHFESAAAKKPDGMIVCILNPTIFDEPVERALEKGILVIAANTDDPEGAEGNARLCFIGSDVEESGYFLAKRAIEYLPKSKTLSDLKVLITVPLPGFAACEARKKGMIKFLTEIGASWDPLDVGLDRAEQQLRTLSYLLKNRDIDMILATGNDPPGEALALKQLYKPGEIVLGGFDLIPEIIAGIEDGWISLTVDQQQYMQGYLPVLALYWKLEYGIGPIDINTGFAVVDATNVAKVKELLDKQYR